MYSTFRRLSLRSAWWHGSRSHQFRFCSVVAHPTPESCSAVDLSDHFAQTAALTNESILYVLKKLDKHPDKALDFFKHSSEKLGFRPGAAVYNLMLRTLAHRDFAGEFLNLARRMGEDGIPIDGGSYFTALVALRKHKLTGEEEELTRLYAQGKDVGGSNGKARAVIDALVSPDNSWQEKVEKELNGLALNFSEAMLEKMLRELKDRPQKALEFFRWLEKKPGYQHSSTTYNLMLQLLRRGGLMTEFWVFVEEMKEKGHSIDIDTYIKLMRGCLKSNFLEDAVKLYEVMMDSPYKPASHDCGMLLRNISLVDPPDLGLVNRVVSKYEGNGNSMTKVVYDGIIRSLTKCGKIDEARETIERMKAAGFEPDNITYSQLVFGLCKIRKLDDAKKILNEMEASGLFPDVKTWTVLIQGHFSVGEVDAALSCFRNMVGKNYEADGALLEVLVRGLCISGRVTDANVLFLDMVKSHVKPHQATFKYLIQRLLEKKELEEALNLLPMMKRHQFPPFADPFPPYISRHGTVEDAKQFLRALNAKDYPSPSAYLILFKSFFKEGRYSEAQDLLFRCPHHIRKHHDIYKLFNPAKPRNASEQTESSL